MAGLQGASLHAFFERDTFLVPVPRSSPRKQNAAWPALTICRALQARGYGQGILELLQRTHNIRKASRSPGNRLTILEHLDTLKVQDESFTFSPKLVLVDDVITKGTMFSACFLALKRSMPDADIRAFALVRTQGNVDPVTLVDPSLGKVLVDTLHWTCTRIP